MATGGYLIYRCRVCKAARQHIHVPDLSRALMLIFLHRPLPAEWTEGDTKEIARVEIHECGGGRLGVADLIGGKQDG